MSKIRARRVGWEGEGADSSPAVAVPPVSCGTASSAGGIIHMAGSFSSTDKSMPGTSPATGTMNDHGNSYLGDGSDRRSSGIHDDPSPPLPPSVLMSSPTAGLPFEHPLGGVEGGFQHQTAVTRTAEEQIMPPEPTTVPGATRVPGIGSSTSSGVAAVTATTSPSHELDPPRRGVSPSFSEEAEQDRTDDDVDDGWSSPFAASGGNGDGNIVVEAVIVDEYQHVVDATVVYRNDARAYDPRRKQRRFSFRESNWCGCTTWTWAVFGLLVCFLVCMVVTFAVLVAIYDVMEISGTVPGGVTTTSSPNEDFATAVPTEDLATAVPSSP
jgi:hypothetical protein